MATLSPPDRSDSLDRLRSALPVAVAAAVLVAVLLGGALLVRDLVELGLLFLANR